MHRLRLFRRIAGNIPVRPAFRKAGPGLASTLLLTATLSMAGLQQARAVVPYRSPEDYGPSIEARRHLPDCRRAAAAAMAGKGKIESESFVQRGEAEYFRFVMRDGGKELLIICDGRDGIVRRQIDVWGSL